MKGTTMSDSTNRPDAGNVAKADPITTLRMQAVRMFAPSDAEASLEQHRLEMAASLLHMAPQGDLMKAFRPRDKKQDEEVAPFVQDLMNTYHWSMATAKERFNEWRIVLQAHFGAGLEVPDPEKEGDKLRELYRGYPNLIQKAREARKQQSEIRGEERAESAVDDAFAEARKELGITREAMSKGLDESLLAELQAVATTKLRTFDAEADKKARAKAIETDSKRILEAADEDGAIKDREYVEKLALALLAGLGWNAERFTKHAAHLMATQKQAPAIVQTQSPEMQTGGSEVKRDKQAA
jgi:hypothetical protein